MRRTIFSLENKFSQNLNLESTKLLLMLYDFHQNLRTIFKKANTHTHTQTYMYKTCSFNSSEFNL